MKLAKPLHKPPRDIATDLVARPAARDELIARAEIAGPGFVNIWLQPRHVEQAVDAIRAAGSNYGRSQGANPKSINVEFVSANPTGPLTVGNARGAFVGDLLCRVLEAVGRQDHARVLLQRLRRARSRSWASRSGRCTRAAKCRKTATTATTSVRSPKELPAEVAAQAEAKTSRRRAG